MPEKRLLEYTAEELLNKFGMGKPTPGSGSAAALQVLVSAQLIRTVVQLTSKDKFKPVYDDSLPELRRIDLQIKSHIYPELIKLFQLDSDQFDKYIQLFKEHERESDPSLKAKLGVRKLKQLAQVTETALSLAKICVELGEFAEYAFHHGFKDVRGDSAMALNGAVASLGGCLAIIELNLLSFEWNDWARELRLEAKDIKSLHQELLEKSYRCLKSLEDENLRQHIDSYEVALTNIRSGRWEETVRSQKSIEGLARYMQNILWQYQDLIWKEETIGNYRDVLRPAVAIEKLLDYKFQYVRLGRHLTDQGEVETAGQIHKEKKVIAVSPVFSKEVQNFTAAHELGHALLHKENGLHRDISLDGSPADTRDIREVQANKFATFFLMPAKQVKLTFQDLFLRERFVANEDTFYQLNPGKSSEVRNAVKNKTDLAFRIAITDNFQGRSFQSMAEVFNVSQSAMAYRLIELDLVEY